MESEDARRILLSTEQEHNFSLALTRILSYQNRNGSWGLRSEDRVTLTSQAIQLMYALNYNHTNPAFKKATRWLEDHVQKGDPHWLTRLEVGLKIGEFDKLAADKYLDGFFDELDHDLNYPNEKSRLDFFWHVLPTLIALYPYEEQYIRRSGRSVPHDKVIERIKKYWECFGENYIAVKNQANHTGLVALYLSTICNKEEYKKYKDTYIAMTKWLISSRVENEDVVHWQHGRGITAYVLIDLIKCLPNDSKVQQCIPKIIEYIAPETNGWVKKDEIKTFNTKLHGEVLYVTIVSLRAMVEVLATNYPEQLRRFREEATVRFPIKRFLFKIFHFYSYYRKRIPIITSIAICILAGILIACGKTVSGFLFLPIGISCVLSIVFDWLAKD